LLLDPLLTEISNLEDAAKPLEKRFSLLQNAKNGCDEVGRTKDCENGGSIFLEIAFVSKKKSVCLFVFFIVCFYRIYYNYYFFCIAAFG
jgi:hypothetical protein